VRPHFRFTIRDLLWLTLVVALALGWSLEHRERQHRDKLFGIQKGRLDAIRSVLERNPDVTATLLHSSQGAFDQSK